MNTMRRRVLVLLGWLLLCFVLDRLLVAGNPTAALPITLYLLNGAACLLTLLLPTTPPRTLITAGLFSLAYFLILGLLDPLPLFGQWYTYRTLLGLAMLLGTLVFAQRLGEALAEFQRAVTLLPRSLTNPQVQPVEQARERIQIEMIRSRRNHSPLSLVVVHTEASAMQAAANWMIHETQVLLAQSYAIAAATSAINKTIRRTDLVLDGRLPGQLMLVAPDTSEEDASVLCQRVESDLSNQLGVQVHCSVATFPTHALTFDDLVSLAEQHAPGTPLLRPTQLAESVKLKPRQPDPNLVRSRHD